MENNRRRSELEHWCWETRGTPSGQNMVSLLDILVNEVRIKNDEATGEEFYRNQGEIRAYKKLLACFNRRPPVEKN